MFVDLLSATRRAAAFSAFAEVRPEFLNPVEQSAWDWLRRYVNEHKTFPQPGTVRSETGIRTLAVAEPWTHYADLMRRAYVYDMTGDQYHAFNNAFRSADVDTAAEAARQFLSVYNRSNRQASGIVDLDAALDMVREDYREAAVMPGMRGVATGWAHLDESTGGYQNSDIVSVVARPGRGKTNLLLHSANAAWLSNKSVLFVSNEMGALQLARRHVALNTRINPDFIRKGMLSTYMQRHFDAGIEIMREGAPRWRLLAGNMKRSVPVVRAMAEEFAPDIIYIDSSYLLSPERKRGGAEGRRETISDVQEEIRDLSLVMNRPIVQTVQLNRGGERPTAARGRDNDDNEEAHERNPLSHMGLHKIAETDVIGQVSAIVMGVELYDAPYQKTRRWMGFLKGREGETGHWAINYNFNPVDFSMITPDQENASEVDLDWMA